MTLNKTLFSAFTVLVLSFGSMTAFAADKHDKHTLVMDIEITGDSSVKGDKEDNLKKITHFSDHLRAELQDKTAFSVVESDAALVATTQFQTEENVLNCNGCEISLAEEYDAGLVMVPYVFRMSHLISTLHIEVKDVETGILLKKKAFDFRGNTDQAWERAIRYAVRDLKDWQP